MRVCQNCGVELIEDAWEEINIFEDQIVVNSFTAWVCRNRCGYYEKMIGSEISDDREF